MDIVCLDVTKVSDASQKSSRQTSEVWTDKCAVRCESVAQSPNIFTSSLPQRSILSNIFINALDDGRECTVSSLRKAVDATERLAAIQGDLHRLEK